MQRARGPRARGRFSALLMQGMLSLLLFAGALHVDPDRCAPAAGRWPARLRGHGRSTVVVGFLSSAARRWPGCGLPLLHCLLFGALISPTDPIAVLGILKNAGAPNLEVQIAGESLFNDGVGVVVFIALLADRGRAGTPLRPRSWLCFLRRPAAGRGWASPSAGSPIPADQRGQLPGGGADDAGVGDRRLRVGERLHTRGPSPLSCAGILIGNQGGRAR